MEFEVDGAVLAAQPVRAQVKFEILESADLTSSLTSKLLQHGKGNLART
jgi:hypothetical protein